MFIIVLSTWVRPPGQERRPRRLVGSPSSTPPPPPFWFRVMLCMGFGQTRLDRLGARVGEGRRRVIQPIDGVDVIVLEDVHTYLRL